MAVSAIENFLCILRVSGWLGNLNNFQYTDVILRKFPSNQIKLSAIYERILDFRIKKEYNETAQFLSN